MKRFLVILLILATILATCTFIACTTDKSSSYKEMANRRIMSFIWCIKNNDPESCMTLFNESFREQDGFDVQVQNFLDYCSLRAFDFSEATLFQSGEDYKVRDGRITFYFCCVWVDNIKDSNGDMYRLALNCCECFDDSQELIGLYNVYCTNDEFENIIVIDGDLNHPHILD